MEEGEDYLDEDMRQEDAAALRRINEILSDHKKEIMNYVPPPNKNDMREKRMSKVQEKLVALSSGADIANIPTTTVSVRLCVGLEGYECSILVIY